MEKVDKGSTLIRMGVSGWKLLLVPAYPGCPGSKAVKRSLLLLLSFQTITCTGNDKYIMHSKHPTDPLADFKTPATLIHTCNSLDSQQFCIQPTKCVVIWPTTSCFADWSKRRHVTLRIIDCQEVVLTGYRIFITCQLTSWHVDKCQGVYWHVVNILRCFCLHFFWDVFFTLL